MAVPLFMQLDQWKGRIFSARQLLVMFDYDGTLTPIVAHPDLAHLSQRTRQSLQSLSQCFGVKVAIVSGRRLSDVRSRVGLAALTYAGNHGLEIGVGEFHFIEPGAAQCQRDLTVVCEQLAQAVANIPGAWVEDKGLTATLHYRWVSAQLLPQLQATLGELNGAISERFCMTPGNAAVEIRPRINWNKGSAAQWLRKSLNGCRPLSIFVGDDTTDEDAFAALPEGITIRVGEVTDTKAKYAVCGTEDVHEFLRCLVALRQ